ncbi:hypothetical protein [Maribacter sp.]|nr:hypothetical protein [Maribacter sp.]
MIGKINLWDLALTRKKEKTKPARIEKARLGGQKDFAMCLAESKR